MRRKLAEAEEPPTTIGEWQERAVRLDRNQRQRRECWGEMQHAQGKMCSQGEDLGGGHTEEEEDI